MDPQRQKQMISQMYQSGAKSEEELSKMTPDERKEYLQSRLKQKMFFSTSQRRSMFQKKQLQEKMEEKIKETQELQQQTSSKTEKNRKKQQKKREKLRAQRLLDENVKSKNDLDDEPEIIDNISSESDYNSD